MNTARYKNWADFDKKFLNKYAELSPQRKRQLVFRGQSDSRWPLMTSLDRLRKFTSAAERDETLGALIRQFRRVARSVDAALPAAGDLEVELLGRHHGLPTSVLDLTRSPYIAAYFAFAERQTDGGTAASVWVLDLEKFDATAAPQVAVIDDDDQIRFNIRAHEQYGVFLKVKDVGPVEGMIGGHLTRHDIPNSDPDRAIALSALASMMISARSLFRDLDGAARTAAINVLVFGER